VLMTQIAKERKKTS